MKAGVSDVAEMVRSVRGYLVVPLKPTWEKGTQLGVQCGDGAVAGVGAGVWSRGPQVLRNRDAALAGCIGPGW